jgi:hypothetical protein
MARLCNAWDGHPKAKAIRSIGGAARFAQDLKFEGQYADFT